MSDDEEIEGSEEQNAPAKSKSGKISRDNMGNTLGKVGVVDIYDVFILIAGILGILVSVVLLVTHILNPTTSNNYWMVFYYIISIWAYLDAALATKLGPALSKLFKSKIGALSFLRDENDAKNFVIVIAGWTALLNIFTTLVEFIGIQQADWEAFVLLAVLVLFGIYMIKGLLQKR